MRKIGFEAGEKMRDAGTERREIGGRHNKEVLNSDSEEENPAPVKKKQRVIEDSDDEEPSVELGAQKAASYLEQICSKLDIKMGGNTILARDPIWAKIAGVYMRKYHSDFKLTYTTFESYNNQMGRFVAAIVYAKSGLEPKFTPGGAHVWRHGWKPDHGIVKCFHGVEMSVKEKTIELNPTSEAGKRAIAEQNGVIEKNRFGRNVVVLRYTNNVVCAKDKDHCGFPFPHVSGSCGMSFLDSEKACSAMQHDLKWTMALYPNANQEKIKANILISTNCFCNYASEAPLQGRQTCKVTPYKLSGTEDITPAMAESQPDMKIHQTYPHTMVYTCCNPTSGSRKTGDNACGWKISAMDLRYAYAMALELTQNVFGRNDPTKINEFKWNRGFGFRTDVIAPLTPITDCTDIFA